MHAVRQACRPKHQVLVLKCYPKFQKTAVDVKPNSSELSYLLYYVSTRRSKVQKVGDFLEKKTASDVWKKKIGNVQVTLQLLKALIEKSPRDLPLYAPSLLRILGSVLRSNDITLAEYSIPTFQTFCAYHDIATLAADQEHAIQYDELVKTYAGFASKTPTVQTKSPISTPVAIRWRTVGLEAIKSVSASEALGSDSGRQLGIIMPLILQTLYSDDGNRLVMLQRRGNAKEQTDKDLAIKRRMSISTVRTTDTSDASPVAVSGTAAEADKLAEEEVGILALQSLKKIFEVNNRLQIRMATASALEFISRKVPLHGSLLEPRPRTGHPQGWATTLIEMLARWAPVQDRFVILVTAMEILVRSPVTEDNLEQQLMLITITSWLLSSTINLIGLSVMDVLIGLIQHVLLLLQLGGNGSNVQPHPQQSEAVGAGKVAQAQFEQTLLSEPPDQEVVKTPSALRKEVLLRLQKCIGDLATHVYYSDQISDMLSAILLRLKPPSNSSLANAVIAIEHPAAAANAVSNSANLQENRDTDVFFSFDTARVTALKAIKDILVAANIRGTVSGAAATGRNRVGVQVWNGTQWLLRDTNGEVRKAYVDALLTWLKLEISQSDLRLLEDLPNDSKSSTSDRKDGISGSGLAKRAISNASQRERISKPPKSTFLQLLHLAIYDNTVDHAESESDILLLHLLLTQLTERLGINAVVTGLPMIMRLQEDIPDIENPAAKVRVGSVVHGYLWALSEKYDFDVSSVGREIHNEIMRRRNKGLWVEKVRLPPLALDQIAAPDNFPIVERGQLPSQVVEVEILKPFDHRDEIIELVAVAYAASFESPPGSPSASPGRKFSVSPITSRSNPGPDSTPAHQLPSKIREQMLSDWCKEDLIANIEKAESKTLSLNGSRTGTNNSGARKYLAVNGMNGDNPGSGRQSPQLHHLPNASRPTSGAYGLVGSGLGALKKVRRVSAHEGSPPPISSSSRNSTVRVDELKRVLSGKPGSVGPTRRWQEYLPTDDDSDSMVSGDVSASDVSLSVGQSGAGIDAADFAPGSEPRGPPSLSSQDASIAATKIGSKSMSPKPASSHQPATAPAKPNQRLANEGDSVVPPVPPIPAAMLGLSPWTEESRQSMYLDTLEGHISAPQSSANIIPDSVSQTPPANKSASGSRKSRSASREDGSWVSRKSGRIDLGGFLKGIEVSEGEMGRSVGKPPY